jgi:hypothetical protein
MSGTYPTLLSNLTMLSGGYCHTEGLAQNTKSTLLVESGYLIATSVIQGICSGIRSFAHKEFWALNFPFLYEGRPGVNIGVPCFAK